MDAAAYPQSKTSRVSALKRLRHRIEEALLRIAAATMRLLPRGAVIRIGRAVGLLAYFISYPDRRVAMENTQIVFGPARSMKAKRRIVRRAFQNLGSTMFGLAWAPRLTEQNIHKWASISDENLRRFREAFDAPRGCIFIVPHYGDWELFSIAIGKMGFKMMLVTEPFKNEAVFRLVNSLRAYGGHDFVPPRFAAIKLFKRLKRGGAVGMLIDANGRRGRGGVWVDFFGVPVFNGSAMAELALRTGAAILFGYSAPKPDGKTEIVFVPPIEPTASGDHDADVRTLTQQCLNLSAEVIRSDPDHWLWTYKRWKRRPTPEVGNFPSYSKYNPNT